MSDTRIRIDLSQGIVEAEGSEEFVRAIYDDFKINAQIGGSNAGKKTVPPPQSTHPLKTPPTRTRKPKASRGGHSIVKDLDLNPKGQIQSLRDFYGQYSAKSNYEKNLIFVYWLQEVAAVHGITEDHVFTCYRSIPGIKVPAALYQSLIDTSKHRGWLDTTTTDDLKVTIPGMNHLEHDLAKADE